ncbi:MAG: STAS domain-containing protein [Novosphingobium sp.]|nr:STAS domain-containing protein [Novosphingobium sp.]
MDIVITDASGVTKAELNGRLDTANVNDLELRFTAGIMPKAQHTIVDLTNVTFIASLGIRMLLTTARGLASRGAKFAMFGANPAVMEIFETTALSDIIPILQTEADAMAEVAG